MLLLQILLLSRALCHWVYGADSHAFTMVQLAYFPEKGVVDFAGNATLDGTLTHSLGSHQGQLNVSQLLSLESSDVWKQRKDSLHEYLEFFKGVVTLVAQERNVRYPIHVHCTIGCQLFENVTKSFYEVLLNGTEFLRFHATNHSWVPLRETEAASYASLKLNEFPHSSTSLQFFLQETCINFVRERTNVEEALTGKRKGRPHAPLVLGISIGSLALIGLAVCIFLCTGGKR
ncbi:endothelial protein C receptor-like [Elgaria multicarinata webbii]|uniref:endothelial protein C receptor-like n=1 Tax=Elgaria multicarinata webbii TaxID=159646 RepID=UPI002FCD473E